MPIYILVPSTSCFVCSLSPVSFPGCCNFQSPLYVSPLFCWVLWPFLKIIHYVIQIASLHNPGNLVILSMTLQKAHIAQNWAAGHDISPLDPLNEVLFCFSSIPDLGQAWTIPFRVLNLNILKYQILLSHNYSEKNLEILLRMAYSAEMVPKIMEVGNVQIYWFGEFPGEESRASCSFQALPVLHI
jgi:hypothetical protein